MAWEWYDDIAELEGAPMQCDSPSWATCLSSLTAANNYIGYDTGDHLTGGSGDYIYISPTTSEKITSYGLHVKQYLGSGSYSCEVTNSINGHIYGSIGGLGAKATIRFAVNHSIQKAAVVSIRSFQNGPWYTEAYELTRTEYSTELYTMLIEHPIPTYTWRSIKSLLLATAKDFNLATDNPSVPVLNNNSTMLLSYIPDESLNNGNPVSGGTDFVIKQPSLSSYVTEYNDSSYTTRAFFLKNKKMCIIGRQASGLVGESYRITLTNDLTSTPYFETTITTSLGSGVPYLGFIIDEENEAARLNVIFVRTQYDSATGIETRVVDFNTITHSSSDMSNVYLWLKGQSGYDEDSDDGNENPVQGGDETDPVINTPLNRPSLPTKGAVGSGFIKLYDISDTALQQLCDFMWDDGLLTNLGRLFNDPREIIVGIMVFPFKPTHVTSGATIYAGNLSTGITADLLTNEYETIASGKVRVAKGNANFMSFSPYRKIKISIPYCGEHDLDPSAVYGATLRLYYHISFFSGNCIAEVTRQFDGGTEEPMWFFGGQLGYSIPLSSEDFTRTISGLISAGVTVGGALATGGASMAAVGAGKNPELAQGVIRAQTGAKVAKGVAGAASGSLAPAVSYSSGGGSSSGFLSTQQPYLIIESAIPAFDGSQKDYIGNTYYKTMKLDECNGFTKCFEAHIEGLNATNNELAEIDDWLTNGVIINHDGTPTPSDTPSTPGFTVITFMECTSERNVIGKKWIDEVRKEGRLIYNQSIETPSIIIEGSIIGKNYAYIGLFKRFYYIADIKILKNNMMQIDLKSDALQTFAPDILDCYASVDRQASTGNAFIEDPYMWTQINKDVAIVPFESGGIPFDFDHTTDTYILTIAGH